MKKKSFRNTIVRYNFLLITILVLVTGMYIFINNYTIEKYDTTYTAYHQLNRFYSNAKLMNDAFKSYLYNPGKENYQIYLDDKEKSYQNLEHIKTKVNNKEINWRFIALQNMLDAYVAQAEFVRSQSSLQNGSFNTAYVSLNKIYTLMDQTNADSYGYLTSDMQKQMDLAAKTQKLASTGTIVLLVYVIGWMIYFTFTTMRSLSDPIEKIIKNMNRIKKGEYDLTQISNANVEMNELCISLEEMAESVQQNLAYQKERAELEKRMLEQQNENLKKDELLTQSELRVLQNQINPHFLFNTLNLIYKMAYCEGAVQTSQLMEKTSQLLRYGLDNVNKISDLNSEVSAIQNYHYIQEKRYSGRISFAIDVEKNVPNIKMPSMILQPLVENAVAHGLKDILENGEVSIEIMKQNEEVVIVVSDNGIGMPPEQLERLVLNDFRISNDDRSHLGLYNVTKRLKAFFHDNVKIIANSSQDCGFEITLRIQVKDGEYDGDNTCY